MTLSDNKPSLVTHRKTSRPAPETSPRAPQQSPMTKLHPVKFMLAACLGVAPS